MNITRSFFIIGLLLTSSIPAIAGVNKDIEQKGQYWQRVSTSSALYLRGPKAQQMLTRDIARCVTELRELERLGVVKNAIPEYAQGIVLSKDEAKLAGYDTPERDKELFAEQSEYTDFEGCMFAKGWERIKYVPFDRLEKANENYKKSNLKYRKKHYSSKKSSSDYSHLNN